MLPLLVVVALDGGCVPGPLGAPDPSRSHLSPQPPNSQPPNSQPTEFRRAAPENWIRVSAEIYSGGTPVGETCFGTLQHVGIKTIVSVDGSEPQVELAEQHGMRYIHIPIGYDGVSQLASDQLVAVARTAEPPYYLHCHHGKHRGPAAAAILALATGALDHERAQRVLKQAGTGREYVGLWRDVAAFDSPTDERVLPPLVARARVEPLAAAMAQLSPWFDQLAEAHAAGWPTPILGEESADSTTIGSTNTASRIAASHAVSHAALQLEEAFRELARHTNRDETFVADLQEAMRIASQAKQLAESPSSTTAELSRAFKKLEAKCNACHRQRNTPTATSN